MSFPIKVELWRLDAREYAREMAARFGVELDEHDVLALIMHESKGYPTAESHSHCRGLGQFAHGTLNEYNSKNPGHELAWADMVDASKGSGQVRAVAWLLASSRQVVCSWSVPDARSSADLWGDLRYGWGGLNTKAAIAVYRAAHGGKSPTFEQLEATTPAKFDGDGDGVTDLRPFYHARTVHELAAVDRAEAPNPIPFPRLSVPVLVIYLIAALLGLGAAVVLFLKREGVRT